MLFRNRADQVSADDGCRDVGTASRIAGTPAPESVDEHLFRCQRGDLYPNPTRGRDRRLRTGRVERGWANACGGRSRCPRTALRLHRQPSPAARSRTPGSGGVARLVASRAGSRISGVASEVPPTGEVTSHCRCGRSRLRPRPALLPGGTARSARSPGAREPPGSDGGSQPSWLRAPERPRSHSDYRGEYATPIVRNRHDHVCLG